MPALKNFVNVVNQSANTNVESANKIVKQIILSKIPFSESEPKSFVTILIV